MGGFVKVKHFYKHPSIDGRILAKIKAKNLQEF